MKYTLNILLVASILMACQTSSTKESMVKELVTKVETKEIVVQDTLRPSPTINYTWLSDYNNKMALINQIEVPTDYKRIKVAEGSFADWLHFLPLAPKGSPVMLHDGNIKPYQEGVNRVLDIDIGKRDLQQCADAIMRLKAEYHYAIKDYENIHFNYTSGHTIRYTDWVNGKKPRIKGSKVYFSASSSDAKDYSYANFKKYMRSIYMYAGTASLSKELSPKEAKNIAAGDVFIKGGFPGHAILVLDVAVNPQGKKIFLLAQSYMPAQSIHIINNFNDTTISPWYANDFGAELMTPEWTFGGNALKGFFQK